MKTNPCLFYLLSLVIGQTVAAEIHLTADNQPLSADGTGEYAITRELGEIAANNLFHSFHTFNLASGETAVFSGPAGVENVISRVTGSLPSRIDGTLKSTIAGADFYWLNPHGIFFGAHSRLEVSGSFYAATADYLQMADGARFHADPAQDSMLSVSTPAAFGFLSTDPAPIEARGGGRQGALRLSEEEAFQYRTGYTPQLAVPAGETLSLTAGGIHLAEGAYYQPVELYDAATGDTVRTVDFLQVPVFGVPGGHLQLVTVQEPGEVSVLAQENATPGQGQVSLQNVFIDLSGMPAGSLSIQAGEFFADDGHIFAENFGFTPATVDIRVAGNAVFEGSSITANTMFAPGTPIRISARNLFIHPDISLASTIISLASTSIGEGKGGGVELRADEKVTLSGAGILTMGFESGDAGNVTIRAENLEIVKGGFISSSVLDAGDGGNIQLLAQDRVYLEGIPNQQNPVLASIALGSGLDAGSGGDVIINARHIELTAGAGINTSTVDAGQGGDIRLQADTIRLSGKSGGETEDVPSNVSANSYSFSPDVPSGDAGRIRIEADNLTLEPGTLISTEAERAAGGDIQLDIARQLSLHQAAITTSVSGGSGDGGNITLSRPRFAVLNRALIAARADAGKGGNISVTADHFSASADSLLTASSRLGVDGEVQINSPDSDMNDSVFIVAGRFLRSADLSPADCDTPQRREPFSRFGITTRPAGRPATPEEFMR